MAFEILEDFGDRAAGQWVENRQLAFHLRRRLTAKEQERIGEAVDCRNTEEAQVRFQRMASILPPHLLAMAREELELA